MAQLLSILFFLLCHFIAMATALNEEGLALLSFKQSIENQTDNFLTNWSSSDANPCSWHGVTCNDLRVVSLTLPNMRLAGSLHPSVGNLSALRHINLRNNRFRGKLPVELFAAEGLQSLALSGNSFSGSVPEEVGRLNSLQSLDLSCNSFNGSIPSSLKQCKKLKTLILSQNNFSGDLTDRFGSNLVNLRTLNLSFNTLIGSIPEDIGNLKNLKGCLGLSHNFFSGKIPGSLGNLPETLYVDLSYNNLSGQIPKSSVLINAGLTAFQGNPLLCGLPLHVSCSARNTAPIYSQSAINPSDEISGNHKHSRLCTILTAIGGSAAGISFLSLLLVCYLRKASSHDRRQNSHTCRLEEKLKIKREFLCFKQKDLEHQTTQSEHMNQHSFVALDPEIDFDLDQLLKASAFLLGKSGIGIVYKVVLENGRVLAVRRLEDKGSQSLKEFLGEVEVIGKIKHPNIVNLRACCWSPEEKLLIYDYIPNGDLASAIHGRTGSPCKQLSWPVRVRIMRGIAKGLAYIHEFSPKRYVHGGLNPSNILLGENLEPKISGFGLGRLTNTLYQETHPGQVSPYESNSPIISRKTHYQAPEASRITKPSQKWDVYSFGLMALEMLTGKSPVLQTNGSDTDLVMGIRSVIEENKPVWYLVDPVLARDREMDDVAEVIKIGMACVSKSPDRRPTMRSVVESFDKLASCV